jgi:hypothetical protein
MTTDTELPNSLTDWTNINLIETFKLTKNTKLREYVAKELERRINALELPTVDINKS